ncbi:MAG: pyrroline-5-carboxylate reductase [Kiritimatiellae bacterium]|nr:pyrroline-5-carboxylate reductase [Kiritimatiellia bacterium]
MKFGFLGSGQMAEAILSGMLQSELASPDEVIACDTSARRLEHMRSAYAVATTACATEMVPSCDVIILAVKPQVIEEVLGAVRDLFTEEQLVVSIAAGKKLEFLRQQCGTQPRLCRVMPNLALMVREGMTAFCMEDDALNEDRELIAQIFGSSGAVLELDEQHFDAVTALSGSGPAFVAYLLGALVDGAIKLGLPHEAARLLAEQTVIGTGIALQESGDNVGDFIGAVCSPQGTTEAGMKVLWNSDVHESLEKTLAAAARRSRELS